MRIHGIRAGWLWLAGFLVFLGTTWFFLTGPPAGRQGWDEGVASLRTDYDVIVVGAEPEGVAAAVAAAREGADVLLLEGRDGPGGLFTYGWLNSLDMSYGPAGELLTRGIFAEFWRDIGRHDSFDVQRAGEALASLLRRERRVVALYRRELVAPLLEGGRRVAGVTVRTPGAGVKTYTARVVVDATQDADVAAAAGVPYTVGGADRGQPETMAATLVLRVRNVDWPALGKTLREDGDASSDATARSAWGFWPVMREYKPSADRFRVRGLNLGRQDDGTVLVNALQIFGVDGTDPAARREALTQGAAEAPRLVAYMRARVPGFAQAELVGTAPELYVRETRHIQGQYVLSVNDVLEHRNFTDKIAWASYPIDVQATSPANWGWVIGKPAAYSIPLRSLLPATVEGLVVTGRSASYSSLAMASARTVPVGMATGQAAGVWAAMAARAGTGPAQMAAHAAAVQRLQERLVRQGAYLPEYRLTYPLQGEPVLEAVRVLRPLGLISAGYENDYRLGEPISGVSFVNLAREAFRRSGASPPPYQEVFSLAKGEMVTAETALAVLRRLGAAAGISWTAGGEDNSRPATAPGAALTRGEAYRLVAKAIVAFGQARGEDNATP